MLSVSYQRRLGLLRTYCFKFDIWKLQEEQIAGLLHCRGPYTWAKCSSETSVDFQQTAGRCVSEDRTLQDSCSRLIGSDNEIIRQSREAFDFYWGCSRVWIPAGTSAITTEAFRGFRPVPGGKQKNSASYWVMTFSFHIPYSSFFANDFIRKPAPRPPCEAGTENEMLFRWPLSFKMVKMQRKSSTL
jgi:hypothetical protein